MRGWEPLVQGIALPDEDDRHVVTAALRGQADLIVTANLSDRPASSLEPLGLEAQTTTWRGARPAIRERNGAAEMARSLSLLSLSCVEAGQIGPSGPREVAPAEPAR